MAIKKALEIKDLLLIQGPPGTGKTTVIAEIVNQLIQKAKMEHPIETSNESIPENSDQLTVGKPKIRSNICPVLITAFTNKAVDNLIAKILKLNPSLNLIRIGTLASYQRSFNSTVFIRRRSTDTCEISKWHGRDSNQSKSSSTFITECRYYRNYDYNCRISASY